MNIIMVSGFKNSGKDVLSNYFWEDQDYHKMSFADELKYQVSKTYNIPINYFYQRELKDNAIIDVDRYSLLDAQARKILDLFCNEMITYKHPEDLYWTPRSLCILEASVKKAVNPHYYTNKVIENIMNGFSQNIVIADWRFINEYTKMKEHFGNDIKTIRINRYDSVDSLDSSELELANFDKFDYIIDNKGTVEDFYSNIDNLIKELNNGNSI